MTAYTEKDLQTHLVSGASNLVRGKNYREPSARIECKSGLTLSVQASRFHYCSPRVNEGPYLSVEVGIPSEAIEELMPYADNPDAPTESVYGYVPIGIVVEIINKHGGKA